MVPKNLTLQKNIKKETNKGKSDQVDSYQLDRNTDRKEKILKESDKINLKQFEKVTPRVTRCYLKKVGHGALGDNTNDKARMPIDTMKVKGSGVEAKSDHNIDWKWKNLMKSQKMNINQSGKEEVKQNNFQRGIRQKAAERFFRQMGHDKLFNANKEAISPSHNMKVKGSEVDVISDKQKEKEILD